MSKLCRMSYKKILLPRFDTHGDLILFEGFIQALLARFPHAEITMLVREGYDQLAPLFPPRLLWISTAFNPYGHDPYEDLGLISSLLDKIGAEQWDLVVFGVYSRTLADELIAAKISNALCVAFDGRNQKIPWPQHVLQELGLPESNNIDLTVSVDERLHETEKYSSLWSEIFHEEKVLPQPKLVIPPNLRSADKEILAKCGLEGKRYAVCLPAGTDNVKIKIWPVENYVELLVWMSEKYEILPLIVGQDKEVDIIEKLCSLLSERGVKAVKWCGKNGELSFLAAIIADASIYIGNDSGPMHIANALGISTVGIFGGGTWPRFKLKGSKAISVFCYLPCYYCMWDCIFGDAPCLKLINVEAVKDAVNVIFSEYDNKPLDFNVSCSLNDVAQELIFEWTENDSLVRSELKQRVIDYLIEQYNDCDNSENENAEEMMDEIRHSLTLRIIEPIRKCISFILKMRS